jgi:hypothetical protein
MELVVSTQPWNVNQTEFSVFSEIWKREEPAVSEIVRLNPVPRDSACRSGHHTATLLRWKGSQGDGTRVCGITCRS